MLHSSTGLRSKLHDTDISIYESAGWHWANARAGQPLPEGGRLVVALAKAVGLTWCSRVFVRASPYVPQYCADVQLRSRVVLIRVRCVHHSNRALL